LGRYSVLYALLAVAQVATPQAGHAVQHFVPVAVVDINVLRAGNNAPAILAVIPQVGKRVEVVGLVQCLQVAGISLFVHGRYLNVNYFAGLKVDYPEVL